MRFFFLLLLVASLAALGWFGLPQWQDFQHLRAQQTVLESIATNTGNVINVRNDLLNRYNAISPEDQNRLKALLPSESNEEQLLDLIEAITLRHGLLLKTISVREMKQVNPLIVSSSQKKLYAEVTFEISVTGTYQSFRTFLAALEQNARLIEIETLSFSSGEADSLEFSIRARARFLNS